MALFARKPKLRDCFFCSEAVEESALPIHYRTHLIEVVDVEGRRAFTFQCPSCGLMDQAWGGGRPDPEGNAATAVQGHLLMKHQFRI
jgi:hypothetical protein